MISFAAIKANATLILVAAAGIALLTLVGAVLVLRSELKASEASLATEKDKRLTAEFALTDSIKRQTGQLANIKLLEDERQANKAVTDPFYVRLDALETPTKDEANVQSTLADRLNSINADANRLLEQSSH